MVVALLSGASGGCLRTIGSDTDGTSDTAETASRTETATPTASPTPTARPDATPTAIEEAWSFNGVSEFPRKVGDSLYAAGFGAAYRFSLDSTVEWEFPVENAYYGLDVDDDHAYVGTQDGAFYAIDRETGEEVWNSTPESGARCRSAPLVAGDAVVVNLRDPSGFAAFDRQTGEQLWHLDGSSITIQGNLVPGTVAGDPPRAYLRDGSSLRRVVPQTGEVEWEIDDEQVEAPPTVADGTVYAGILDDGLLAVDAETGEKQWTADTYDFVKTKPAVSGGWVFFGSHDNSVYAVRAADGEQLWRHQTGAAVHASPVVHRGSVYVSSGDGNMYAFDSESGSVQVKTPVKDANYFGIPVVTDDRIYRVGGADLLAYDLSLEVE